MTTRTDPADLTPDSLALFDSLARSSPDWSGQPLFEGTKEERGNLTHLKRAGLVVSQASEGHTWVSFTAAGIAFADSRGIDARA